MLCPILSQFNAAGRWIISIQLYLVKHYFRIALLIQNDTPTNRIGLLPTSFATLFPIIVVSSLYILMSSSLILYSKVIFSCNENIFISSFFTDSLVTFSMTSCSNSFHPKTPLRHQTVLRRLQENTTLITKLSKTLRVFHRAERKPTFFEHGLVFWTSPQSI